MRSSRLEREPSGETTVTTLHVTLTLYQLELGSHYFLPTHLLIDQQAIYFNYKSVRYVHMIRQWSGLVQVQVMCQRSSLLIDTSTC